MTITVFSQPACRDCKSTEKRMNDRKIKFTKVMLNEVPEAAGEIEGLGHKRAPVVVITDDSNKVIDHWSGFRETKIEALEKGVA